MSTDAIYCIKPIETFYDGILFRSRLEARWTYVFKTLGLRYIYEYERYIMHYAGARFIYLPDFYMIDFDCFVEVKGKEPTQRERELAWVLSKTTHKLVHIVAGQVPYPYINEWDRFGFDTYTYDASLTRFAEHLPTKYALNSCVKCGRVEFVPNGDRSLLSCACEKKHTNHPTKRIGSAFGHARTMRFDRGRKSL